MQEPGRSDALKGQIETGNQRQAILLQILRAAANMHHIDELLSWLSQMATKYFNVQVVQIWANQADRQGQISTLLRGMACQDILFPQNFLTNPQIVAIVERMMQGQLATISQSVEMIFPQPVAMLLKRYRLNYCVYSFLNGEVLLPPSAVDISQEQVPTPLMMVMLLLSKQAPTQDFLLALDFIFQNTLSVAVNRGLLLPATVATSTRSSGTRSSAQNLSIALFELIPHRLEDVASSPLMASGADLDRSLRGVYTAINGRRNVVELSRVTKYSAKDVIRALKNLAALGRIELYGPDGHPVDSSLLPDNQ